MTDNKKTSSPSSHRGGELQNSHTPKQQFAQDGYQAQLSRGYKPQGGHQPTTSQGAPANPPNQGSGVKPPPPSDKK